MSSRTNDYSDVVKRALHDHLDGVTVNGTTVSHHEDVPDGTQEPYLVNGRVNMTPRPYVPGGGYKGSQNYDIQMDGYSRYDGDKEIDELRSVVVNVLMQTMTVEAGFAITDRELQNSFTIYEDDGDLKHGVVEARIALQIF